MISDLDYSVTTGCWSLSEQSGKHSQRQKETCCGPQYPDRVQGLGFMVQGLGFRNHAPHPKAWKNLETLEKALPET